MYSLRLICAEADIEEITAELWEAGTTGIRELDSGRDVVLIAGFDIAQMGEQLVRSFSRYTPEWYEEEDIDWIEHSRRSWPDREVGTKLFLAPQWSVTPTPIDRIRVIHNPGLACGTGEHPCTRLALLALEDCLQPNDVLVDVGTGSGLLALAASKLGAGRTIGLDTDFETFAAASENFALNNNLSSPLLVAGSADCLASGTANLTVANISGSVLLFLLEELIRITARNGWLILSGFPESEAQTLSNYLPSYEKFTLDDWCCLRVRLA